MAPAFVERFSLTGKRALVTGASKGIGLEICKVLADAGADVVAVARDQGGLEEARAAVEALGRRCLVLEADMGTVDGPRGAARAALEAWGGIDILVNNAGIAGPNVPVAEYPPEAWSQVMRVNLDGPFLCCRAVVPLMTAQNYGRIVNIASIAGKEGNPNAAAYSASKAGVIALTKSLGKELAGHDIAVNCITPAAAKTAIFDQMTQQHIDYMLSKIPRARFVEVEEIAALVAFCASAECSFTTGAVFDISGGRATY
jgi:2-dehydro-3-deoxy-L-rhamnonate dehydrogenase (NAD+)